MGFHGMDLLSLSASRQMRHLWLWIRKVIIVGTGRELYAWRDISFFRSVVESVESNHLPWILSHVDGQHVVASTNMYGDTLRSGSPKGDP